jgi:hypothetical protein
MVAQTIVLQYKRSLHPIVPVLHRLGLKARHPVEPVSLLPDKTSKSSGIVVAACSSKASRSRFSSHRATSQTLSNPARLERRRFTLVSTFTLMSTIPRSANGWVAPSKILGGKSRLEFGGV